MTETDRWVKLEGLDNVRDVGGLPLDDGGVTRSGVLLRSASLHYLTPSDVRYLVDEFGLRLVLDLRRPDEIDRDGPTKVAAAGVETVPLTFIGDGREALPAFIDDDTDPMLRNYLLYLADQPANVVTAVRRIAAPDGGPTLVHCLAGKDRTGTLVALVLDAIGVERAAVVADYVASGEQIEAMFRRWTTASGDPMPADLSVHTPRPAVMAGLLERLDAEYGENGAGGAVGWLRKNGVTDEELAALRARLTA